MRRKTKGTHALRPVPTEGELLDRATLFGELFQEERLALSTEREDKDGKVIPANRMPVEKMAKFLDVTPGYVRAIEEQATWPSDRKVLRKLRTLSEGFRNLIDRYKKPLLDHALGAAGSDVLPPLQRKWNGSFPRFFHGLEVEYGYTDASLAKELWVVRNGVRTHPKPSTVHWYRVLEGKKANGEDRKPNNPTREIWDQLAKLMPELLAEEAPKPTKIRNIKSPSAGSGQNWTQQQRAERAAQAKHAKLPPIPKKKKKPKKKLKKKATMKEARRKYQAALPPPQVVRQEPDRAAAPAIPEPKKKSNGTRNGAAHAPKVAVTYESPYGEKLTAPTGADPALVRAMMGVMRSQR